MAAASRFGRYGPMDKYEARGLKIDGTEPERLRARREMLRSMDPETAKTVIEFHRDLNFFQALALAQREGSIIVPNFVHDRILTETTDEQYLKQNYPVLTGTLIIYEAPGKPFAGKVVFNWEAHNGTIHSISFIVPEQFRRLRNCALVVEHPDFDILDSGNNKFELRLVHGASVHLIEQFPKKDGWHMPHAENGIPHGRLVKESSDSRHLWRITNGSHLGSLGRVRFIWLIDYGRRYVNAYDDWSYDSGVAFF